MGTLKGLQKKGIICDLYFFRCFVDGNDKLESTARYLGLDAQHFVRLIGVS
jgi:hypothetical protein